MVDFEGKGRNDVSPTKGIDTRALFVVVIDCIDCRNDVSPTKGIDTLYDLQHKAKASRNDVSPTKGIDTLLIAMTMGAIWLVEMM